MSDLQNLTPANTYKALLQLGDYTNGISGDTGANALQVSDGAGNNTSLALSTDRVGIGNTSPSAELDVSGDVVADEYALDQTGSSSSAVAIHAPTTNELAIRTNSAERVRIDSSGNVGIGTTAPTAVLHLETDDVTIPTIKIRSTAAHSLTTGPYINFQAKNSAAQMKGLANIKAYSSGLEKGELAFNVRESASSPDVEAMRIDSDGNVGIGTTSPAVIHHISTSSDSANYAVTRHTADSQQFDVGVGGSTAAITGVRNKFYIFDSTLSQIRLLMDSSGNVTPGADDAQDFGSSSNRWDDIYATNTTIQSSDRELKQDIEELTEAETRVAQACKGLLRKYRWKDAVAQKGDEARIHFGIIAQDLEDAFTAEGLDAGRYGMFVKNTWWTADRVIPAVEAVEAVYDEEGNEVSPAIEAQPEETVTDIFENSEDAPEGATEVTQRGVRYSELLAFIISAI